MSLGFNDMPHWQVLAETGKIVDAATGGTDAHGLLVYARNILRAVEPASDEAHVLVGWLARNRQKLGLHDGLFTANDQERGDRRGKNRPIGKIRWAAFDQALRQQPRDGNDVAAAAPHSCDAGLDAVAGDVPSDVELRGAALPALSS